MTNIAVIGAGPAGLATSLFLARRGHQVTLVEKDAEAPPADPEACFQSWSRRGVAQARQPHVLLARSSAVLRTEAPDVLDAFGEAGAHFVTNTLQPVDPHRTELPFLVTARRLVFEAVLRRKVLAETGVRWMGGVQASGLVVKRDADIPRVTSVTLAETDDLSADLTVDASGRFSQVPQWLEDAGLGPLEEDFQDCGFSYMTRWYRLDPGAGYPPGPMPLFVNSAFVGFYGFLADGDVYALGMYVSLGDPLASTLRKPEAFERVMAGVAEMAAWRSRGQPISDIQILARIENRSRTLLKDGAPLVAGLALVGDSAMHTNPSLGRGVSMAYVQAQRLAQAVTEQDPASAAFVRDFEVWREQELGGWFQGQARSDSARIAAMDATLAGRPLAPPSDPATQFINAVQAVMPQNPSVALAFGRMANMLITPTEMAADPAVRSAVSDYLAAGGGGPPAMTGPSRERFVALATG